MATTTAIAIVIPLDSPSLLDTSLERVEVVGDMVPVGFNADVVGALVTIGVEPLEFVPIGRDIYHAFLSFKCTWRAAYLLFNS
jgi:hypothetical protein